MVTHRNPRKRDKERGSGTQTDPGYADGDCGLLFKTSQVLSWDLHWARLRIWSREFFCGASPKLPFLHVTSRPITTKLNINTPEATWKKLLSLDSPPDLQLYTHNAPGKNHPNSSHSRAVLRTQQTETRMRTITARGKHRQCGNCQTEIKGGKGNKNGGRWERKPECPTSV